jgi:hypothetical protein
MVSMLGIRHRDEGKLPWDRRQLRKQRRVDEQRPRRRGGEAALDHLSLEADVDRLGGCADPGRREHELEMAMGVPGEAGKAVPGTDAEVVKRARERPDPLPELAVGERGTPVGRPRDDPALRSLGGRALDD